MSPLANVLWAALRQRGWDAADLVKVAEVPKQTVSNILNDVNKGAPKVSTLAKLAKALDIPTEQLVIVAAKAQPAGSVTDVTRAAVLLERLPWLSQGIDRIAELDESEFRQWLDFAEYLIHQRGRG